MRGAGQPRPLGHVEEGAVAEVAQQAVTLGRLAERPAVVRLAAGQEALLPVGAVEAVVVADVEVEPAVGVVVEEGRGDAEATVIGAGACGDVLEATAVQIAEQLVRTQVGHVEVDVPVPVVVAGGDADVVAGGLKTQLGRDVDEAQLRLARLRGACGVGGANAHQVVAEDAVARRLPGLAREHRRAVLVALELAALAQVDVQVAVVVVVEEGHARADHLRGIEPAGHAVEVHEVDTDFRRRRLECGSGRAAGRQDQPDKGKSELGRHGQWRLSSQPSCTWERGHLARIRAKRGFRRQRPTADRRTMPPER